GIACERRAFRQGVRSLSTLACAAHCARRAVGARDGAHLSRAARRAPGAQRSLEGPHAGALLRRTRMAVWLARRELSRRLNCRPKHEERIMSELGRLEDLPADYRDALTQRNLVPLWPSLRGVRPPPT